ncbi:ferritin-like domain-containing protein [Sphingosinicella sp. BN140058]|uniref:ferritin-like domain-containing protein n=1 Tax=Sphingosinicella sp. BN140058 TaxID=1892855 RepID=UPI0013ED42E7|nr:ferritin-like domain-containing protein [Sphingosinicella sp. BN140058]
MIETREQLIHTLTEAAEIEHNLLCSYLYAVFSMKRAGEPGLDDAQGEAVERWRKTILKIALEEMAHLACVNNLLIAIGGAPHFDRSNFPVAPGYHPADVVVRLTPFDAATLDHFIFLERPEGMAMRDAEGFEPSGEEREVAIEGVTPSAQDYPTVGALYDSIATGFCTLVEHLGESTLIDPAGRAQMDSELIKLPNIPRVTDLETALSAIRQIKEEGEGSSGGEGVDSHFDRFRTIRAEWQALHAVDPGFTPAWPAAHDPVMRRPIDPAERLWITEPEAAGHLDLANAIYGMMLSVLSQTFSIADAGEQRLLMRTSVELMEASASISNTLARLPANADRPGINAGMTFAVPRNASYRPLEGRARALFLERARELAARATQILNGETAEKALRRLGNAIGLLDGSRLPD